MDSQNNDLNTSSKSKRGLRISVKSKQPKIGTSVPLCNEDIDFSKDPSPIHGFSPNEHEENLPFLQQTAMSEAPAQEFSAERQLLEERNLTQTNSAQNLTTNTRTPSSSFPIARTAHLTSQSAVEMKIDSDNMNNLTPLLISLVHSEPRPEPAYRFGNSSSLPEANGFGVSRLFSQLTSLISSRSINSLDERALNNFNMEVGTIVSRVDMWRERLEDERTNSVRSHSRSANVGSSPRSTDPNQTYSFISDEIHHLIQLIRDLTSSLFGRFTWGLLGIEDKLMLLLERGSHMVSPMAEILIMNVRFVLMQILDLYEDDTEKAGRVHSVVDTINNGFCAIRSLILLGNAYRNAHEQSDGEYSSEDSRSLLARSIAYFDRKN